MTDSLPEDAWVNCFLPTPPRPLLTALSKRLQASNSHNTAIADLYKQRAAIEKEYADSLSKLAKQAEGGGLIPKNGVEWDKGGGEAKLWENLVLEMSETSTAHSTLAAMIRSDFEQPVRDLPSKIVAWRRISEQESTLDKALKDYEKTSGKLDKASNKSSKADKANALQSELNQLTQNLSTLSPMVYTTFQKLDEQRLKSLKEIIVRWATVKGDIATRDGQRAESGMMGLLSWEPADEVLAVGTRLGQIGGRSGSVAPSLQSQARPTTNRRLSSATNTSEFRHPNGSNSNIGTPGPGTPSGGGGFGGLKGMLGRSKTLARGRSNSYATSVNRDRDAMEQIQEPQLSESASRRDVDEEGFSVPPPDRHRNLWDEPDDEITPAGITSTPLQPTPKTTASSSATPQTNDLMPPSSSGFTQQFQSSPSGSREDLSSRDGQESTRGMNLAIANAPIEETEEERQAALAKMQQTLQSGPPQPTRRTTTRGRRDVRNTMFGGAIAGAGAEGLTDEPGSTENGTMSASPSTSTQAEERPGVPRQSSMSSFSSNNPFDSPSLGVTAPVQPPALPIAKGHGLRANITESINVIMRAGEIIRLQINGEIHVALKNGSSMSNGGPSLGNGEKNIHLRLDNFESLEKIAPNPQYLSQVPDRAGEYYLNTETIQQSSRKFTSEKGTLLFKYQVYVEGDQQKSILPLIIEPAYLCKSGETRMILNYKYHPNSISSVYPSSLIAGSSSTSSPSTATVELKSLSLSAGFEPGVNVKNVQAKPAGGIWSPSTRKMTWELGDLHSSSSPMENKIIAKFVTEEGESMKPQSVQANWIAEGILASGINLNIVEDMLSGGGGSGENGNGWKFEEVRRGLSTGKYLAEPIIN